MRFRAFKISNLAPGQISALCFGAIAVVGWKYQHLHLNLIELMTVLQYWFFSAIYLSTVQVSGPKLWAISRLPWALHVIKGDLWAVLDEFHVKYGRDIRIAPNEVTSINPAAWKDLYLAKPVLPKNPYSVVPPLGGSRSLFSAEGDTHRRIRAALATHSQTRRCAIKRPSCSPTGIN